MAKGKIVKVRDLLAELKKMNKKQLNKQLYVSSDEEGNSYHPMYYFGEDTKFMVLYPCGEYLDSMDVYEADDLLKEGTHE